MSDPTVREAIERLSATITADPAATIIRRMATEAGWV